MSNVKYFIVKEPKGSKGDNHVAHFTSESEAVEFSVSPFMVSNYGGQGVVEQVNFVIYTSSADAINIMTTKLRDSALSKLTPNERRALGLTVETDSVDVLPTVEATPKV